MFSLLPTTQNLSICLRCQHRIATHKPPRIKRINHARGSLPPRFFTSGQVAQERTEQRDSGVEDTEKISHNGKLRHSTPSHSRWRHADLHIKDPLGVDALGQPAEVLLLRNELRQAFKKTRYRNYGELSTETDSLLSSDELLASIEVERATLSADDVRANIESLKDTWLSSVRDRFGPPGPAEVETLSQNLRDGFTAAQLQNYFDEAGPGASSDPLEIDHDFSSELYKRSAWIPGLTLFPDVAQDRLRSLKFSNHVRELRESVVIKKTSPLKKVLADKIIRQLWRIQTEQQKETPGEVDIWIQPDHLDLLLNHSEQSRGV